MNEVELVGVSHSYNGSPALDNISIGFRREKITVVIGRSGMGKSTLLKSINGLVRPHSGKILVSSQPLDYTNIAPQRRMIGYVVQGNGLFPHLTVAENISLPSVIAGEKDHSKPVGRTSDLLYLTRLNETYANKYPWELSGGEQQRVALCRALFLNPPVMLMDEPFGALDPMTRRSINNTILEFQKIKPLTMIIVTHDMAEARRLADDLLVLEMGRVVQFGSKENVIHSPADPIVRGLLEASIN
ncbi:MAG TPA: ATP-binding cassette domain-containing protein [Cyclobacteriaceae bacterium]|nr:ATP-binding cassette domain-containing protein [Cyclobacteriaceae bacterium]